MSALSKYVGGYVRVMQFLISLMLIVIGFMHIDNALGTNDWCGETTAEEMPNDFEKYSCIGDSLVWGKEDKQYTDNNAKGWGWRNVFTLSPDNFFDTWTPFMAGLYMFLQCFPAFKSEWFCVTWAKNFAAWFFLSFFAMFGYAGNMGIAMGFITSCFVCPFHLVLMLGDDDEMPETQLNLPAILPACCISAK